MLLKTAKILAFLLVVFLAILAVFPLFPSFKGWYKTRAVLSGSMEPVIPKGSIIINKWFEDKDLRVGEIITFARPDQKDLYITHRIVQKEKVKFGYFFRTKGDQVVACDPWKIHQGLIEGKIILVLPYVGYLYVFTQTPWGFLFLILLPAWLLILGEIKNIKKEMEKIRSGKSGKLKNAKILIFFLVFVTLFGRVWPVHAYFVSNTVFIGGITLATVGIISETEPPVSSAGALPDYINRLNFEIPFLAQDNLSEIKKVELYYSRDLVGGWLKFSEQTFSGNLSVSGEFSFTSPLGEGYYRFLTVSLDEKGNLEYDTNGDGFLDDDELYFLPANSWTVIDEIHDTVLVDTAPPVTMLSADQSLSIVNDQIYNGGFENGNLDGWETRGEGVHQATDSAVKSGNWSALLGDSSNDSLSKTINLAADSISTLSFWYRLLTDDNSSGGFFETLLKIEDSEIKIAHDGWDDPTILETDLGWKNVTYQLDNFLGKAIDLNFSVIQPLEGYKTWVYLDDIRLTSATNSATINTEINFLSHDGSGSGTAKTEYRVDESDWVESSGSATLSEGIHKIDYFSTDLAGNIEATKSATISATVAAVDFGVVINEFLPDPEGDDYSAAPAGEWVELYNNSTIEIDLNGWKLKDDDGHELVINSDKTNGVGTIISSGGKLRVYRKGPEETSGSGFIMNNNGDTVFLLKPDNALVDSFSYTFTLEGKSYKREPDGIGTWKDPIAETISLASSSAIILPSPTPEVSPEVMPAESPSPSAAPIPNTTATPLPQSSEEEIKTEIDADIEATQSADK